MYLSKGRLSETYGWIYIVISEPYEGFAQVGREVPNALTPEVSERREFDEESTYQQELSVCQRQAQTCIEGFLVIGNNKSSQKCQKIAEL